MTQLLAAAKTADRRSPIDEDRDLVDAFVSASRALVAVAARSLSDLGEEVTLPQYRALVVLSTRGPQRAADLAASLDVTPSTGSRMIERLVRKHLVRRVRATDDRRTVRVHLTPAGRETVARVTERRRAEIVRILEQMPVRGRRTLTTALRTFAAAAGEAPEQDWALGWDE
jgi:DNA-binding MarR family transcriptional regulator